MGDTVGVLMPIMAGLSVTLFVMALFRANRTIPQVRVTRRMEALASPDDGDPLAGSFADRVLRPAAADALRVATAILPTRILAAVDARLEMAGRTMTTNRFVAIWGIGGFCLPVAFALLIVVTTGGLSAAQFFAAAIWAALGIYLPWTWLRRKADVRRKRIAKDLPDAIDLIITNVEAGLGLQAAFLSVSEKYGGPVGEEFGRVVREISVGHGRTESLVTMAERTGVADMRLFARAVAQAETTGIPVARVLRNHSREIREKRQQRAREQAAKIPVKITLPTVLVMFPTLFMLILGPVALNAMEVMGWR